MVTVRGGQERYETIIPYKINCKKRLRNHVHVHVSKTKESLYVYRCVDMEYLFQKRNREHACCVLVTYHNPMKKRVYTYKI
jgi:hypothetical protein